MKVTKTTIETVKTITIAVLITGIIAFVSGMMTHAKMSANVDAKVKSATTSKNQ